MNRIFLLSAVLVACGTPEDDPVTTDPGLCAALPARSGLDLDASCVDGLCIGMTVAQAQAHMGPPDWSNGNNHYWDAIAVAAENGSGPITSITVEPGWSGGTDTGLGLDVPVECFSEILHLAAYKSTDDHGEYTRFHELGLMVGDVDGTYYDLDATVDGYADLLILTEPY